MSVQMQSGVTSPAQPHPIPQVCADVTSPPYPTQPAPLPPPHYDEHDADDEDQQ